MCFYYPADTYVSNSKDKSREGYLWKYYKQQLWHLPESLCHDNVLEHCRNFLFLTPTNWHFDPPTPVPRCTRATCTRGHWLKSFFYMVFRHTCFSDALMWGNWEKVVVVLGISDFLNNFQIVFLMYAYNNHTFLDSFFMAVCSKPTTSKCKLLSGINLKLHRIQ